jgi:hypothetical protein
VRGHELGVRPDDVRTVVHPENADRVGHASRSLLGDPAARVRA